ncbi:Hsp70 family protein [Glycomyces sp. TRM65418]|uniref:Hsp70 family protein n=1 Tax=Glycomyces sp. TRM65418 TaxID=2867006 RepID=UPI001CE6D470|nr:Hsp70 family protein [Glycomyces sp. TRM65418]MCC3763622.1 Hsp70 family protein [Glycomyces sp. TRM65418]QZD57604.1 Hsp70 family protein [Glycomyces sp. TRM65418]
MPADYLLSVDLGTSHTVAVVVWPDGRTRPLLFDGSPVMPSAVFLDPAGTLHTGRDAERLALTAPERFEPNPKQRIGDGTILLGDREVPVTAAFAAILSRVARTAVESVGHLPDAVLTCPAAWSEQRRGTLHDAAAQAGYRPVKILTEPVAAAHYYTSRLANPLAAGQALAVFDFGGGTLDIAVLERRQDGSFGVLADGGLHDLGGLDFDAALVAHIGETVRQREPEIWKRLENPSGASELRNRRELWEEVRAAKEMLSRSSVAPVTVPDMAQSLHLTRGELDQISRPLLSRAVGETQRVLALTGRHPSHLAGLFLVGGSSRMPMVAKMLHEGLGIAPTVLEQPELPVSEGAALALAGPAPMTPPAPVSPPMVSTTSPMAASSPPTQAGSLPPVTPGTDETLMLRRSEPQRPKSKIRPKWIAIAATVVVLAIALPLGWRWITDPYKQRPFAERLDEVGDPIALAAEADGSLYAVRTWGDKALFAYTTGSSNADGQELHVRAVDAATGEPLWEEDQVYTGDGWDSQQFFVSEELIAFPQEVDTSGGGSEYRYRFIDWETGETRNTVSSADTWAGRSGDLLAVGPSGGNAFTVYDADGETVTSIEVGDAEAGVTIAGWDFVGTPDDLGKPSQPANGDGRVWLLTSDNVVHVYDLESGETLAERELETVDDDYFAWDGLLYITVDKETGYELNVYDIEDGLSRVDSEFVESPSAPETMVACGETYVCVRETVADATDVYTWSVYDSGRNEVTETFDDAEYRYIEPIGNRLMVEYYEGDDVRTQIYDKDFDRVGNSLDETFDAIDGGSALSWPGGGFTSDVGNVIGLGRDGTRSTLRTELEIYGCDASDTRLACFTLDGMQIYSIRDE